MRPGRAVRLLLLLAALALATLALGAPRFTWANDGVHIRHPPAQAIAAIGAALALAAAAWAVRPRSLLVAATLGAGALALLAAERFAFRIDAVEQGVLARSLGGSVGLAWQEIEAVEPRDGYLTLRAHDARTLVIASGRFAPDERVRLERTIARRVREAAR